MKRAIISGLVFVLVFSYLGSVPQAGATEEQQPLWSYETDDKIESVAISSDGNYIVSGSAAGVLILFSKEDNTPLWIYDNYTIRSVAISADGNYIAVACSGDHRVYLFSRSSSTPLWSYETEGQTESIAISSDGNYIVAGDLENNVYLFHNSGNSPLWSYQTGGGVFWVAISSDGNYVAAGSEDGCLYMFSRTSNTPIYKYRTTHIFLYFNLSMSSDGSCVFKWGGNVIPLLSPSSSTPLQNFNDNDFEYAPILVAISSDGSYIAVGSGDNKVGLFSRTGSAPLWVHQVGGPIRWISISSDGSYIITQNNDGKAYLFDKSGNMLWSYEIAPTYLFKRKTVSISSDGNYIVAVGAGKVYLFSRKLLTTLTVAPSNFVLPVGGSTTLTTTLTSSGTPLAGKTINFSATAGSVSPSSAVTDSQGQITATYTALSQTGTAVIVASFAGDNGYAACSENSSCTICFATLTFCTPDGSLLTDTEIYYGLSSGQETNYLGTTDNEGKIIIDNSELANQTIYFKTSDEKYVGSTYIGSTGGSATIELTEVSEPPILWIAAAVIIVAIGIGAVVFVKKRKQS